MAANGAQRVALSKMGKPLKGKALKEQLAAAFRAEDKAGKSPKKKSKSY